MKLDRWTSIAVAAASVVTCALASGCSSAPAPKAPMTAAQANVSGTTSLMSAHLDGPAPRVGKAHLAVDDEIEAASSATDLDESAPKDARRSDGSRRGGGFGSTK